jgi:uncharacterized RDD family membrane protein YckC
MQIYLSRHGERIGPYSLEEINHQLAAGTLTAADLGWSESSPGWKPILSFAGVIMPGGASSTAALIGIATPITFGLPEYAGFWIRVAAHLIDAIILAIFILTIALFFKRKPEDGSDLSVAATILQIVLLVVYMPALWASPMQATAGQRICRLRVVQGTDGNPISFGRGLLRVLGMIISGMLLGIGYLMVAFTERKRGLHDMLADTCVVKDSFLARFVSAAREL